MEMGKRQRNGDGQEEKIGKDTEMCRKNRI
jgi:hypothetical protein